MSIGSFFNRVSGVFKKLFDKSPTWAQTASTIITLISPMAETIVALAAGQDSAVDATQIAHEVQSDLAALAQLVTQSHGDATNSKVGQVRSIITAISDNLDTLLKAGHISNATTLAKIEIPAKAITGELQALLQVLPATPIAPTA